MISTLLVIAATCAAPPWYRALPATAPQGRGSDPVITEPFGLNCGSETDIEAGDGITYGEDWDYVPGRPGGHEGGVRRVYVTNELFHAGPAQDLPLYQENRIGHQAYHFAVEPGARYELTLRLWEPLHHGPEARRFDLAIDGASAWTGIDPYALVGAQRTLGIRHIVRAADDLLDIELIPQLDQPLLSGIALRPVDGPPAERLEEVQLLRAQSTYHGALLSWKHPERTHLDGYRVTARSTAPPHLAQTWRTYREWTVAPAGANLEYEVVPIDAWGRRGRLATTAGVDSLEITDSTLPWFSLQIDPADLRAMEAALPQKIQRPASLDFEHKHYTGWVTFRGESTLLEPKKSYRFRITDGRLLRNSVKVNLAASFTDATLIREAAAYSLMQLCDIEPYQARLSRLDRNHTYHGLLAWVEATDEDYLERIGLAPLAHAYEVHAPLAPVDSLAHYLAEYSNINRADWYRDDLIQLIQELDATPLADLEFWFRSHFDIPQLLNWYAAQVITANDDFAGHNYILYHDPVTDLWSVLPVDSDEILYNPAAPADHGSRWSPNRAGDSNLLVNRLLSVPALQRRLFRRMRDILTGPYAERADAIIDSLATLALADGAIDPYKKSREVNSTFVSAVQALVDGVAARPNHLLTSIDDLIYPPEVALALNEFTFHAGSDTAADTLAQVELHYRGLRHADFSRLWLSRDPHDPHGFWLGARDFWEGQAEAIDLPLSFGDADWIGLYTDLNGVPQLIDSTSVLPDPVAFGRLPDGYGPFRPLPVATPGQSNRGDPLLTIEAAPLDSIIYEGDPLRYDVTLTAGAHALPPSTLEIHLFGEGGVRFSPDPARTTFVSALDPGEIWNRTIEFAPPPVPAGRIDAEFRVQQSLLRRLATTRATLYYDTGPLPQLLLNEFCADNRSGPSDAFGEHDDWVELFNGSDSFISLDDYFLTDDYAADPYRWPLPSGYQIAPGARVTLWLDGQPEQGPRHASFRLASGGESLALVRRVDDSPERVDWILFGPQNPDWSYGRYPDGRNSWEAFPEPSFGAPNHDPDTGSAP